MSSRAQGYRSRKRRRSYGPANKERRHRSLGVWRNVEKDSSEQITALLEVLFSSDLDDSETRLPAIKQIHGKHTLPILNPLLVKQRFAQGFEAGYNFHRSMQAIEELFETGEKPDVSIGGVSIFGFSGKRSFIGLDIVDERHKEERLAVHRSLAKSGIRGFNGNGSKVKDNSRIIVAQTSGHVHTEKEIRGRHIIDPETGLPPMSAETLASQIEQQFLLSGVESLHLGRVVVRAV